MCQLGQLGANCLIMISSNLVQSVSASISINSPKTPVAISSICGTCWDIEMPRRCDRSHGTCFGALGRIRGSGYLKSAWTSHHWPPLIWQNLQIKSVYCKEIVGLWGVKSPRDAKPLLFVSCRCHHCDGKCYPERFVLCQSQLWSSRSPSLTPAVLLAIPRKTGTWNIIKSY